jgi:hypothetical protein
MFSVATLYAQPACQPGYQNKQEVVKFYWNGFCCDVTVYYCFKVGSNTLYFEPYRVDFDPACFGLDPNAPPPFSISSVYTFARKKVVAKEAARIWSSTIPPCPQMASFVLDETASQCWTWQLWSPGQQYAPILRAVPCDNNTCRRICQVCMTQEIDPCDQNVTLVNIGPCTDYGSQLPCPGSGDPMFPGACQRITCQSP